MQPQQKYFLGNHLERKLRFKVESAEREVMQAIENLDRELTVLIVAHRLTTLQHCDAIVKFDQGKLISQGTYNDLMNSEYGDFGLQKPAS